MTVNGAGGDPIDSEDGERLEIMGAGYRRLRAAFPVFEGSAWLVAATVMEVEGTEAGEVYTPEEEIVPVVGFPPGAPLTLQVTLWSGVLETVAANCCDPPIITVAALGETLTEIAAG